jgi:hypothetical protein
MKPVLWYHPVSQRVRYDGAGLGSSWIPLYKKHEWVGLTDEEVKLLWEQYCYKSAMCKPFAHAIEEKLKEKNA